MDEHVCAWRGSLAWSVFFLRGQLRQPQIQVFYDASRKLILKGVDGVVFVADSQQERLDANIESFESLQNNLREYGEDLEKLPFVIQYNKRDLNSAVDRDYLDRELNLYGVQSFEAVATTGQGVFDTLKAVSKQVLVELKRGGRHSSSWGRDVGSFWRT